MSNQPDPLPPSFTQLRFEWEDASGHQMVTHDPVSEVKDIYEEVEQDLNQLRNSASNNDLEIAVDETPLPRDLRQNIISLYTLSTALIERFAADILLRELIPDTHQENENIREWIESQGVSDNIRMLYDLDLIDNGLHGELQSVTTDRNDFVHNHEYTLYIDDYNEFLSRARRCKRATKELATVLDGHDYRTW